MHLTLVIPELIWHEPGELSDRLPRTPALDRLLAWGRLTRGPRRSLEAVLAEEIGDARTQPVGTVALATARALGDGLAPPSDRDEQVICADPVHLHFHQDRMLVADASVNPPDAHAAATLIDALNAQFAGTLRLVAGTPTRWYAYLSAALATALGPLPAPLSSVAGHQLPTDGFGRTPALRQLASELQMALHAQPRTQSDRDAGRQAMNALWLWGNEVAVPPGPVRQVASDEALGLGLAVLLAHTTRPLPTDAVALLHAGDNPVPLAVLDALDAPGRYQDHDAYAAQLAGLESRWFMPLERALTAGALRQLTLVVTGAYGVLRWQVTPPTLWARRPWAAPAPDLATRARQLAELRPT